MPDQALEHQDAEGIEVAPRVRRASLDQLRGVVLRGGEHHPQLGLHPVALEARQPEVEQHRVVRLEPTLQEHVRWLQVAVDDSARVDIVERLAERRGDRQPLGRGQGALLLEVLLEVHPLEVVGEDVEPPVLHPAHPEVPDDVGVLQGFADLRLV
jgi:hypothetical protein